jgi:CRISPR/Cas system-associated exonuclease Cas4 (RecB family)
MQVYAATLAVRREYPSLSKAIIYTRTQAKGLRLGSDDHLFSEISDHYQSVSEVKKGLEPIIDMTKTPCGNCGYRHSCRV